MCKVSGLIPCRIAKSACPNQTKSKILQKCQYRSRVLNSDPPNILSFVLRNVSIPTIKLRKFRSYLYFTINLIFIFHLLFVSHLILLARYFPTNASTRSLLIVREFKIANCIPLTHRNRVGVLILVFQRENYHWTEHYCGTENVLDTWEVYRCREAKLEIMLYFNISISHLDVSVYD